jgi:very-short-patch-repair endonuclease
MKINNIKSYTIEEREAIRKLYKLDPYLKNPYAFKWKFSPIEYICWGEIRSTPTTRNFRPEYPIGPYFVDFADPVNKIIFECDSIMYHTDKNKDLQRQKEIEVQEWKVFRFSSRVILSNIYEKVIIPKMNLYDSDENIDIQEEIEKNKNNCIACFFRSNQFKSLIKHALKSESDLDYLEIERLIKERNRQTIELIKFLMNEGLHDEAMEVYNQVKSYLE